MVDSLTLRFIANCHATIISPACSDTIVTPSNLPLRMTSLTSPPGPASVMSRSLSAMSAVTISASSGASHWATPIEATSGEV